MWSRPTTEIQGAQAGLKSAIHFAGGKHLSWANVAARYREYLYGVGHEVKGTRDAQEAAQAGSHVKSKGGFSQREIEAVLAAGGKLTMAQALRCRIRYFTAGAVLGSQGFVDAFFERQRSSFGERRAAQERRAADEGSAVGWLASVARSEGRCRDPARVVGVRSFGGNPTRWFKKATARSDSCGVGLNRR